MRPIDLEEVRIGKIAPLPGRRATSGIDKQPIFRPLWLSSTGLAGDEQADLKHHGGPDKAIHHYPREHYPYWADMYGTDACAPGTFGENFSTVGMTESNVCIGDTFTVGGAVVQLSQGRQPCWKLDVRLGKRGVARQMQNVGLTGWYYRVVQPGWVAPGNALELVDRSNPSWTVARILHLLAHRSDGDSAEWAAAAHIPALAAGWRKTFADRVRRNIVEDGSQRLIQTADI